MSGGGVNIHATAIIAGTRGILFVGPSGAGKSALAFACMAEARSQGQYAALISDDRVIVSAQGGHLLARRPEAIRGLIEVRHGGIAHVESQAAALLHLAVAPVDTAIAERLPPEDERLAVVEDFYLPLLRVPVGIAAPLATLDALFLARQKRLSPESPIF